MSAVILDSADGAPRTRVFIVEDEALIAMEVQDRLGALGYQVCGLASRGEQALEAIIERAPDVVLMDVRLAGTLTGIETAERLRVRMDVPVIFLSAYSDSELLRRAGEVLPFGYLVKPFEERELHATIQMAIYKHRMERALREAYARLDEKVQERTAELAQSRADLAVTLDSIGDAVLATDASGRITRMNPAAEQLTGWKLTEAVGLPIEQVFLIINEQTREPAAIPVAAVLATGQRQMLANHTALITRNGAEISIADSAAPIRNTDGGIVGVVLVFRDETQTRERRKLIARQRTIAEALRRVQQRFISSPDATAPIEDILSVLLYATNSDSGFISEVRAAPDGSSFLEIQAATGGPWDLQVPLVEQAIASGRAATGGEAFIAAPILVADKVVGVIGVANRAGGYDESILAEIEPLLATYGSLIEARRSALRRRAAEESLQQLNASLETEVQRRAATFETLASLSPVGIVRMDAQAKCLYVNQRYCEMLGITREAALGKCWTHMGLHPHDKERILADWERALSSGRAFHCDCRFIRPDAQTVSVLVQTVPTVDSSGTVDGHIGTLTDVTEQKQMEQALRVLSTELVALEGSAFFRRMVQQLATLLDCEISIVAGIKTDQEEPALQTLAVYEDGEFTPDFICALSKSPWTEETLVRPVVIPSGMRAPSPYLSSRRIDGFAAVPLLDHAGTCIGQLAVMSRRPLANPGRFAAILHVFAISATAQIEQQRGARRFHDLFEFSPDAIVMTDRTGTIRLVNRKAEAMFGWSRAELVGQSVEHLLPDEDRAKHVQQREHFVGAHLSLPLAADRPNLHARRKDGTVFPVEIGLGSIETGEGLMIAAAVRDITERRNAERQANRARRLESIGTLAGGIAHDLNNALTPILLTLDLLKQQYPTEHETLDTVEHSANHAAEMVRHLLAFAKGSEGKRVSLAPRRLLEEMEKIIKGTFPKNIQVRLRVPKELPTVLGDATQLHQVLLNLCVNARDAMPEGGTLTLEAELTDGAVLAELASDPPPDQCVVLRVTDTGTGIAPEVLERIFDPFFTTKEPESGTGLGLFTVAGIVKGHGGLIRVSSQPGRGSTFAVLLPAEQRPGNETTRSVPMSDFTGHGEVVLYVDDEVTVRDAARAVLERLQFTPLTASDGMNGLVQAVQHRATLHAVITDLHMPHMDGLAFVRALRKALPDVPVIVASGRLEPAPAQELRKLGVHVMLEKPFTQEKLAAALQTATRSSS